MVKKITTGPDDLPTAGDDHGVLPEAGLDTTAIGILGPQTAQVRVVLPQVLEEPDDDEVVDDEIEPVDLRGGGIVIELPAGEYDEDAAREAEAEPDDEQDDAALTAEIDEDVLQAVHEQHEAAREDDERDDVIDVYVVPDVPAAGADGDAEHHDHPADEAGQTLEVALVDEDAEFEDAEFEDEAGYEESENEPVDAPSGAAGEPVAVDGWRAAAAALAAEHATARAPEESEIPDEPVDDAEEDDAEEPSAADDEPQDAPEHDAPEPAAPERDAEQEDDMNDDSQDAAPQDAAQDTAPAKRPQTFARMWAEESAAARPDAPGSAAVPVKKPQTTGAVEMTARRLEDLGRNADRESSDLLTPDRVLDPQRVPKAAPEGTWSELVYGLTGGRINIGDGRRARARKELEARVAAPLSGETRFVPVLSRKGGVGKTTVTTLLGMALADGREDRVIAIDANPDRGTLADRIGRRVDKTVRDLVHTARDIRGFSDMSRFVARDETRLDVLASDTDPRIAQAFGEDDYRAVADVAEHFYSLVLTDTGTGIIHSVMSATLAHAHQLVIVTGLSLDEVRLASETLTWLESNGFDDLARNAIVVLNQHTEGAPMVRLNELEVHFGSRVRTVVHLPYDPALATGSAIVFGELQPQTRQAARELAARVIDGLREGRAA